MHEIIVITTGRSGSSIFLDSLSKIENSFSYAEILHPNKLSRVRHILHDLTDITQGNNPEDTILNLRKNDPIRYMNIITEYSKRRYNLISYKCLPYQILNSKEIIDYFLNKLDAVFLFLVRSKVDTYISFLKANYLEAWSKIDTTNIKIKVNYSDMINYANNTENEMKELYNLFKIKKHKIISYEDYINDNISNICFKNINLLKEFNIFINSETIQYLEYLNKQDKNVNTFDKISNREEIILKLKSDNMYNYIIRPFLL